MDESTRLITIYEWRKRFHPRPAAPTVRKWIRQGRIDPPPIKHGRNYYLADFARYVSVETPTPEKAP